MYVGGALLTMYVVWCSTYYTYYMELTVLDQSLEEHDHLDGSLVIVSTVGIVGTWY